VYVESVWNLKKTGRKLISIVTDFEKGMTVFTFCIILLF